MDDVSFYGDPSYEELDRVFAQLVQADKEARRRTFGLVDGLVKRAIGILNERQAEIEKLRGQIDAAVSLAVLYGGTEESHHKAWVIDQMVRALAGDNYEAVVAAAVAGEDGPDTYEWDVGIAP